MTKKIIISLIFVGLITLGVLDIIYIGKTFNKTLASVSEIETLLDERNNLPLLKEKASQMEQDWVASEKKLTIFLYYRDIDTLGKQVNLVSSLIQEEIYDDAKVELLQLKYLLNSAKKVSEFSFDNLL